MLKPVRAKYEYDWQEEDGNVKRVKVDKDVEFPDRYPVPLFAIDGPLCHRLHQEKLACRDRILELEKEARPPSEPPSPEWFWLRTQQYEHPGDSFLYAVMYWRIREPSGDDEFVVWTYNSQDKGFHNGFYSSSLMKAAGNLTTRGQSPKPYR